jgi:hypothetical protein
VNRRGDPLEYIRNHQLLRASSVAVMAIQSIGPAYFLCAACSAFTNSPRVRS